MPSKIVTPHAVAGNDAVNKSEEVAVARLIVGLDGGMESVDPADLLDPQFVADLAKDCSSEAMPVVFYLAVLPPFVHEEIDLNKCIF